MTTTPFPPTRLRVPGVTWMAVTPMVVFTRYDGNHGSTAESAFISGTTGAMISSFCTCHLRSPIQSLAKARATTAPGMTTRPPTSMTGTPAGGAAPAATRVNRPSSTTSVASSNAPPLTVNTCAPVMAKASSPGVMAPVTGVKGPTSRGRSGWSTGPPLVLQRPIHEDPLHPVRGEVQEVPVEQHQVGVLAHLDAPHAGPGASSRAPR